jgi:tRNA U38,U39,U40 pseudouridine synthase TruA
MMAVLFLIGEGTEPVEVIKDLLDPNLIKNGRPNYDLAESENLMLFDCGFENLKWTNYNFYADYDTYKLII